MYERKVYKKKYQEFIDQPDFQYMNVHQSKVKRLSCFTRIQAIHENQQRQRQMRIDNCSFGSDEELLDELND